jgi:hypothetical protein
MIEIAFDSSPNYNSTKLRFVYFGLIEEGLWIKRKHEFFVCSYLVRIGLNAASQPVHARSPG